MLQMYIFENEAIAIVIKLLFFSINLTQLEFQIIIKNAKGMSIFLF